MPPETPADPALLPRAERLRRAVAALDQARLDAVRRGERPAKPLDPSGSSRVTSVRAREHPRSVAAAAEASPARRRRDDPQPVGAAIADLLSERGWRQRIALGVVFGDWARIVGRDVAAHTRPEGFTEGELVVAADSTAWATQVRLLAAMLVRRVNAEVGAPLVRRVRVRGPTASRWPGRWRVAGGRGPGDTYG